MRLVIIASLVLVVVSTPNRPSPVPLPAVSLGRWLPAPLEQRSGAGAVAAPIMANR